MGLGFEHLPDYISRMYNVFGVSQQNDIKAAIKQASLVLYHTKNDAFDVVTICYNDNVSLVSSCFSTFELETFRSLIRLPSGRLGQKRRSRNRSSRRPIESDVKLDHDKFQSVHVVFPDVFRIFCVGFGV